MSTKTMHKTTIYLPDELRRAIRIKAKIRGVSQAEFIRLTLDEAVKDTKKEKPRSFGIIHDGSVDPRRFEEWLDEDWVVE